MASARRLYRLALGLGMLGAMAVASAIAAAAARTSFTVPAPQELAAACRDLLPSGITLLAVAVLALAGLGLVVLWRAGNSLVRQLRGGRLFRRDLSILGPAGVGSVTVTLIEDSAAHAFCAGYLRPRIYLSTAALARLSESQLAAVLSHESHHRRRRDPLRLLLVRVLSDALFFLPAVGELGDRYRDLSEVAADEAATEAAGAPTVAAALLAFNRVPEAEGIVGIAPERVDHLLGDPPGWQLPLSLFLGAALSLTGLGAAIMALISLSSGHVDVAALVARSCMALMCGATLVFAGLGLALSKWRDPRISFAAR
jgi:hypothetical protein